MGLLPRAAAASVAAAVLLLCAAATSAAQLDPHLPDSGVPSWFEGWYIRLMPTDASSDGPSSLSLIVATQPNAPPEWGGGMASLTVQGSGPSDTSPTSYTLHGLALGITGAGGAPKAGLPDRRSQPALRIASADGRLRIEVTGEACVLEARFPASAAEGGDAGGGKARGVHLRAECEGPPVLWDDTGFGPEGRASALPGRLTGLHWFVHSLATPMRFTLRHEDTPAEAATAAAAAAAADAGAAAALTVQGSALAHWEKNWGRAFPAGWHWAQGVNASANTSAATRPPRCGSRGSDSDISSCDISSSDSYGGKPSRGPAAVQAAFALGGGALPSPLFPESVSGWIPDMWLLGVRTATRSWDFHAYDSIFTAQADPCAASLLLSATQPLMRRGVDVQIKTRPASFASLEGPTGEGFRPYMDESLAAYATVRLFELTPSWSEPGFFQRRLVEAWEFYGAALEFGGDRRCQKEPSLSLLQKAAEAVRGGVAAVV